MEFFLQTTSNIRDEDGKVVIYFNAIGKFYLIRYIVGGVRMFILYLTIKVCVYYYESKLNRHLLIKNTVQFLLGRT